MADVITQAAEALRSAQSTGNFIRPLRETFKELDADDAYAIQKHNIDLQVSQGARIVGSKIGLTSLAVQRQIGVDQPDYGVLLDNMECPEGVPIAMSRLQQPKIEAEIAFILGKDLDSPRTTVIDVIRGIDYVVPALEIVGSRIEGWDIRLVDTIADNASSSGYVLGTPVRKLDGLDLRNCAMTISSGSSEGRVLSSGAGMACLGNPLNAVVWLSRVMNERGFPLKAGSVVLSGALGPMVAVEPGETYKAHIDGLGDVTAAFATD
ncbi:4-oxalocrotonate decarboxylase [Exophiala aquamarina CBS 119918]|uniref:4-oxalocrotonate decarboxylase n=1 Tax=Exophiala aquamarina CBS 119918 TaxID=1182545 RepID=A0A072PEW1_9EURO|nr:4-oxalocrotonate decarboxylase [Exophiala aquamarina CBS 119918]KEF54125.1 4-oxalocrotonate decarboxylase [Exophiala aquamarina CBS 119918]